MKRLAFILVACMAFAFSCKVVKEYIPVERIVRETVTVRDTVIEVQIKQMHDSVTVNLLRDTTSYLENEYAYSYVMVVGGELLLHSLGTKNGYIPVKTKFIEIVRVDSIPYLKEIPVPGPETIIHKPSFWQIVQWLSIGIVSAFLGMLVYKIFD
jgi:hypothetical protein